MQERYNSGTTASTGLAAASRHLRRTSALLLATLGLAVGARAQQTSPYFRADAEARSAAAVSPLAAALTHSQALTLDEAALRAALATAPFEGQAGAPLELALPRPDGSIARFAVRETSVMAPELARKFPSIKTYVGAGLDDRTASLRLDLTPKGFHAQVLAAGGNTYYIDPVTRTDTRHYLGFFRQDMNRAAAGAVPACNFAPTAEELKEARVQVAAATASGKALASGSQLRTYRLALANTPEYAVTKGNTVTSVLAAEVTTLNRVVGVYEKELAVRMVLVANNDQLVFLRGIGTQPSPAFDDSNTNNVLLSQNQSNIDRIIGTANYDIGHVVSTGGGGVASYAGVCTSTRKAQGVTGLPNPVGDAFDIDYVAHEMGHQFSGSHPFNGNGGSCSGGNRKASTAWEPGSGSTIMAYAGICGTANDLQPHSDATFHTGNYQEMRAFISSTACGTDSPTGNTAPVVTAPASGKTLPISTPFKLTAAATDAENDPLTYMWEEMDLGPTRAPNDAQVAGENVPLFRSFVPLLSSTRYFPRLTDLVNNTTVLGERLPTVTRTLKFRCTARDQHSGSAGVIGGVDYSPFVDLNVTSTAGPFVLSAPNTATSWTGGTTQAVTWNVAGTDVAPVSCATVNLRLSLDGGLTYPVLLASAVPNTGTASVTVPNVTATQARVMVEAADNYFFDISDINFAIAPGPGATITGFTPTSGPVGTTVALTGTNFTGATAVSINGTPATFVVNSPTSLTVTVAAGTTSGLISVTTPNGTAVSTTSFLVGVPPTITSFTPATGAVGSTVVITGTNFTAASQVTFAGTNAPVYSVNSATQITVTVPIGAVTGPIAVTTPLGTGTSATSFTIPPAPAITSFSPTVGVPGTQVTINGSNFTGTTRVTFNGAVATVFTVVSANQITATVPTGATTGRITVTTPNGIAVSASSFTVQVPVITSFTPTSGPAGTQVTITGNYFTGATQVTFNGTPATVFTVVSATQITVTVPVGATSGPIVVTAPVGSGTSATPFLIPPANDQCANAIALACGQTLTGTNVGYTATGDPTGTCGTAVRNGGVFYTMVGTGASMTVSTCSATTDFDTQLFVYSGRCGSYTCVGGNDDAATGLTCSSVTFASQYGVTYFVLVNGYLATNTGTFGLTLTCATPPAAPAITSLSPTSGPVGSTVTVTGSNLTSATGATINGVAVTGFTVVNATTVTFTVPAGATTGNVVLTTATGIPSNGTAYTVTTVTATAQAQQSEFSVYPNPVAGRGTLNLKLATSATAAQVTLRTVLGQVVATRTFSGAATELPMSGLAAGTYLLTVQAAGRAPSVQRVVVE
ncbi:IPT/TIG domain-containing protein [Hymenobacter sp. DH14]|uniref:IPT/TIG domain-containing protein n=1 Tax=Hymenobacter cyanobacteriorum TaxID=2926463 RepID=A0A9X2AGW9_9BACT|nr:IPT/TIG domain-containing protein [Hymenobacter cyanobacteriorum]MCI1189277.1 IPT/TIG domain-containing protein [Hymenobacter cyanobacteriorum]